MSRETAYILLLGLATLLSAALAYLAARRRPVPGALTFSLTMLALAEWSLAYLLEVLAPDLPGKMLWARLEYIGIVGVPVGWLIFSLQYTGRAARLSPARLALLAAPAGFTLLAALLPPLQPLIWRRVALVQSGPLLLLDPDHAPLFWAFVAYAYILLLAGSLLLVQALLRSPRPFRGQAGLVLLAALLPWAGNALYLTGLNPLPGLDLTPVAFTLSGLALAGGLFRFGLLYLTPLARDALVESMPDAMIVLDLQHRILDFNPAAARLLGAGNGLAAGRTIASVDAGLGALLAPAPRREAPAGSATSTGAPVEHTLRASSGAVLRVQISPLRERHGRLRGHLLALRDITERALLQRALEASEARYRTLVERVPAITYVHSFDISRAPNYTSPQIESLLGFTAEEWSADPDLRLRQLHPDDRERALAAEEQARGSGAPFRAEYRLLARDGRELWFRDEAVITPDENGRALYQQGIMLDITASKLAELALQESEDRYRDLVEHSQALICTHDLSGKLLSVNGRAASSLGYKLEELVGQNIQDYLEPEFRDQFALYIAILKRRGAASGLMHVLASDGTTRVWEYHNSLRTRGAEAPIVRGMALDITEQRQTASALRRQLRELATLHAVAMAGAEAASENELIERVTRVIGETLYPDNFGLLLLDESERELRVHPSYRAAEAAREMTFPLGQGITGRVAADGQPRRVADVAQAPEYIGADPNTRSELCVPLVANGRVIGVINTESARTGAFGPNDERLLATVAGQLGTAIARLRLFQSEAARARRQEALVRLSAGLAAAFDETEISQRVTDGLHGTLGYDHLGVFLLDENSGDRVLAASAGWPDAPRNWRLPPGKGLSARALQDGQMHYTPDVTAHPEYIPGLATGAEVDLPLTVGGTAIGVLIVESNRPFGFDEHDFALLTSAANLTALAISKARLLADVRRRVEELDALRATGADISAELDLPTLLQAILQRAVSLLDATGGDLGLYDAERQQLEVVADYNFETSHIGVRLALGEGAMGRVAESGEPLIVHNYNQWEGRSPQYDGGPWQAVMNTPLVAGNRLIGVISVFDASPTRRFGDADLRLLNLFGQQAAIAIENARLFETVQRLAVTDVLTGVSNRRHFFDLGGQEFERARRFGHPLSAIMLDIDHFKRVNDSHGHAVGDQVLRAVATSCRSSLREIDLFGRYGGEEFAVLLPETGLARAKQAAERLRNTIVTTPAITNRGQISVTISLGVASRGPKTPDLDTLLEAADHALYRAKNTGRNRIVAAR